MEELKRFGKYLLLDHLVDGGMAQIYRARFLGENVEKIVAIKMIQDVYSKDASFKKMFLDEIKVTFALSHPNIAQIYDYGEIENKLYTAMEYVDGQNLKQFSDRLSQRKFIFPIEITLHIISNVCQGLNYAHHFKDKLSGNDLNIIHRDISPHNIMITYDGSVKIIDFGIAKADTNTERTQAGTIKGKLSYLAPEYLENEILDARYDQFAVGITLWELLCGRKLFTANNELAVLKKIQTCEIPKPSSINPNIDKEIDNIVLKALSKDRSSRYEDMDQFNRALVKYLYSRFPNFNPSDLGYFAHELFKEEIDKDRKKLVKYGKIDIRPYLKELSEKGSDHLIDEEIKVVENLKYKKLDEGELDLDSTSNLNLDDIRSNTDMYYVDDLDKKKDSEKVKSKINTESNKKSKVKRSTRFEVNSSSETQFKNENFVLLVKIFLFGGLVVFTYFNIGNFYKLFLPKEKTKKVESLEKIKEKRIVSFLNTNYQQKIFIDGKEIVDISGGVELETNQEYFLRAEQANMPSIILNFKVFSDKENIVSLPLPQKNVFGVLKIKNIYPEGTFLALKYLGGVVRIKLPCKNLKLPPGQYESILKYGDTDYSRKINFVIKDSTVTFLER